MTGSSRLPLLHGTALLVACLFAAGPLAAGDTPASGVSPEEALKVLKGGNQRFFTGGSRHPHQDARRLTETSRGGQHPFATVITCSDSRVPVEEVFDQGVGDLFVIRVAGNVIAADEAGSIEYGVDHLGTPVLVVLGHTNCGAVTAVVTKAELHGNIPALVAPIQPAVAAAKQKHPELEGEALVPAAVIENVWHSIDDLFRVSPVTRDRVRSGKLKVVGAIYDLANGRIEWMGEHPEQSRLLKYKTSPEAPKAHLKADKQFVAVPPPPTIKDDPKKVVAYLRDGNRRYQAGVSRHPRLDAARRHDTAAHGQHPFATVIACSDSRVPVEELFDAGIGDLFVVRVAGNVCDVDEVGSIEYGVDHLQTPVLVVLGHSGCGAVTAVATHAELHGSIPALVDNIEPAVARARAACAGASEEELINAAVVENVWQGIADLLKTSAAARERILRGKLRVVGAVYDLDSGAVRWLGTHPKQPGLLKQVHKQAADAGHADGRG